MKLFWSRLSKNSGRPKDNSPACAVRSEPPHTSAHSKSQPEVARHHLTQKSTRDHLSTPGAVQKALQGSGGSEPPVLQL